MRKMTLIKVKQKESPEINSRGFSQNGLNKIDADMDSYIFQCMHLYADRYSHESESEFCLCKVYVRTFFLHKV